MPRPKKDAARPGTVIDVDAYRDELDQVRRWIETPSEQRDHEPILNDRGVPGAWRERLVPSTAGRGASGGRLAVAAGQYLVWYFNGLPVPRCPDSPLPPFYDVAHVYWGLVSRRLELDARVATDLVHLDCAGRGDTEPRHATVKLLERNFTPPAPEPLNAALRGWGDELAVHSNARFRKLATRAFALAGEPR